MVQQLEPSSGPAPDEEGGQGGGEGEKELLLLAGNWGTGVALALAATEAVALVLAPNEGKGRGLGKRGGDSGGGSSSGGRGVSVDSLQILCRYLRCGVEIKVIVLTREACTYFACPNARDRMGAKENALYCTWDQVCC